MVFFVSVASKSFKYAIPVSYDNYRQNVIAFDAANDETYVITLKQVLWATLTLFQRKQVDSARNANAFTAQQTGNSANAELTNIWNSVLITKHSDTTQKLLEKVIWFDPNSFWNSPMWLLLEGTYSILTMSSDSVYMITFWIVLFFLLLIGQLLHSA